MTSIRTRLTDRYGLQHPIACAGMAFVTLSPRLPVAVCEERDPKGLYQRARAGELDEFTGISAPYEPPESPELSLDTAALSLDECVTAIFERLHAEGLIG